MAGSALDAWNNWSIQILVLFSLGCQIALFFLAGIRRHGGPLFWRGVLWTAYQLADFSATYAIGHLSLTDAPRDQVMVAFWAPFLLLHLGGPDNITAYSLEDNKIWKRHMLNAFLLVFGAVYVLYEHIGHKQGLLLLASTMMCAIGAIKYWERSWALMGGDLDNIRDSIEKQPAAMHGHFHPQDEVCSKYGELNWESLVRRAHSLFHICKRAIVDCTLMRDESHGQDTTTMMRSVNLWQLMEIELSLLYDMFYTKAAVIHTCFGYLVRLISPVAIVASLLMFKFIDKKTHRRADVNITYILYGGALFMETTSLLNVLGSSWTFAFLCTTRWQWLRQTALCNKNWDRLRRVIACLHNLVRLGRGSRYRSRRWTYILTQYNMLHFCSGSDNALTCRPLLGSLAKWVGQNELWDKKHYSWVIGMPHHLKDYIFDYMQAMYKAGCWNDLGMFKDRWGEHPLRTEGFIGRDIPDFILDYMQKMQDAGCWNELGMLTQMLGEYTLLTEQYKIFKSSLGIEFQECIIIWHIGTDVFLAKSERAKEKKAWQDVEDIKVISNYMMYLLVDEPDMLPGIPQNRLYQMTCDSLKKLKTRKSTHRHQTMKIGAMLKNLFSLKDNPNSDSRVTDREDLAKELYEEYKEGYNVDAPRLSFVAKLATELLRLEQQCPVVSVPKLVREVWMNFLVYAGSKCTRKFHAEKLNNGGELTTIMWLMTQHFYQLYMNDVMKSDKDVAGEGTSSLGDDGN